MWHNNDYINARGLVWYDMLAPALSLKSTFHSVRNKSQWLTDQCFFSSSNLLPCARSKLCPCSIIYSALHRQHRWRTSRSAGSLFQVLLRGKRLTDRECQMKKGKPDNVSAGQIPQRVFCFFNRTPQPSISLSFSENTWHFFLAMRLKAHNQNYTHYRKSKHMRGTSPYKLSGVYF